MGGSGYKKFKKQEKARVKLKGNKTLLPKGQNVTDTTFKVKKIVVKEQLKGHGENEILTKKHLSIKELISRLSHHNVGMRQEALSGLKELITAHGADIVQGNLSLLLRATMALTVDREADVRSDTLKLISAIFDKVTEEELAPLFSVVVCHLTCAMTHIEPAVRGDSLRLMDAMLAALPTLTAAHTPTLLPHFLDLISYRGGTVDQARTLSLHLDGRITSEKWRARVIGRLNKLFSVICDYSRKDKDSSKTLRSLKWTASQSTYLNLYAPLSTNSKTVEDVSKLPMQEYAKTLMPLLLDTFTEAVPKQDLEDSQTGCVVGTDSAALLQSIVEVILHIWDLLKLSSQSHSLTAWFLETWGETVLIRLFRGRFPYSVSVANSRKRQRETDQILAALQTSWDQETGYSLLNLQLCHIAFLCSQPGDLWQEAIQYIRRSLRGSRKLKVEESAVLCQCLEAVSDHPLPADVPSLLTVLSGCNIFDSTDKPVNNKAFNFLTSVALRPSHQFHQDKQFTTWLDSLPGLLCKPTVPLSTVRSIAAIATRRLPAFYNSLDGWIEEIMGNLPIVRVTGDIDDEGPKLIASLIYWVSDWDQGLVDTLRELIHQSSLDSQLTHHLIAILKFKVDSIEDTETRNMIESVILP